jgi:hypothetical protein
MQEQQPKKNAQMVVEPLIDKLCVSQGKHWGKGSRVYHAFENHA